MFFIFSYVFKYINTYSSATSSTHPYIRTSIHTSIHIFIGHIYIHTSIHTPIHTSIHIHPALLGSNNVAGLLGNMSAAHKKIVSTCRQWIKDTLNLRANETLLMKMARISFLSTPPPKSEICVIIMIMNIIMYYHYDLLCQIKSFQIK